MPYVSVPKDLFAIKTKFMFNLTKRQVYCFTGGAGLGLALHFFMKNYEIASNVSSFVMVFAMFPFFIFAMYEKNGKTFEVILKQILTFNLLVDNERPYKTKNIYTLLDEQDKINKELTLIVGKNEKQTKQTKTNKNKVD